MSDRRPTAEVAAFVAGLSFADVPSVTMTNAKRSILDTLGCALHGAGLEWSRIAQATAAAEQATRTAVVWGTPMRTSASLAAWLNGTASHAFEFDDVHMGGMIHTGALTVSAALPVAAERRVDGATFLAAVIAGTEVGARVGRAVGTQHFRSGYHPQGTVGVFAAAAAAARATGADDRATQRALGIAGSHAAGLMASQRGSMVKRLHSGNAARNGVVATQLAIAGFTGIDDVLEAEFGGFCSTMAGGAADLEQLTDGLGERWETDQVAFKPYPSCAAAQASIEAARMLKEHHRLDAADVAAVEVVTSEHVHAHSGWRYRPEGVTAAQMSIGYGVARMLIDGTLGAHDFDADKLDDPTTLALTEKIDVVPDPAIDALGPDRRYVATVRVTTRDGIVHEQPIADRPGNVSNPMSTEQLERKFHSMAAPVLGEPGAERLAAMIDELERLADVSLLAEALASSSRPSQADEPHSGAEAARSEARRSGSGATDARSSEVRA